MSIRIITILSLCFIFSIQAVNAQITRFSASYIMFIENFNGAGKYKPSYEIEMNFSVYYDQDKFLWSMYFPEERKTFNFKVIEIEDLTIDKEGNITIKYITLNEDNEKINLSTISTSDGSIICSIFNKKSKEGYIFSMRKD